MRKRILLLFTILFLAVILFSFKDNGSGSYAKFYHQNLDAFNVLQAALLDTIKHTDINSQEGVQKIENQIQTTRNKLKTMDFWFRYLEPTMYKRVNGPLPVEWETEVFEKFEKPYKRDGAGLTLAALYLDEPVINRDSLLGLVNASVKAMETYGADSITNNLNTYHHFFLCNRLYLLNLAAIYTTGFECPDTAQIIPELRTMLKDVNGIYAAFNESFPSTILTEEYLRLYKKTINFVNDQPANYTSFDHFVFIRDYVNPLFTLNQKMIKDYKVVTHSLVDYSLNKAAVSIFKKNLYNGQNGKGLFHRVTDTAALAQIERLGKLLFYDPILSGNNMRSCASCHKPTEFFTDTMLTSSFQYNHTSFLPRNTPSLLNTTYNHLLMLDGKHFTLQNQTKAVVTNPAEMGGNEQEMLMKVLSCDEYKNAFKKLLQYTPTEPEISFEHIASAITLYYAKFSSYYSSFDDAMNEQKQLSVSAKQGFNLFMSKAQCGTCHFVPQFNGVKPPFVGSEFEVLGVPKDTGYKQLSDDKGRYEVNPATETMNAFRTGSVRNSAHTAPYMHNGVFRTMDQVIEFYNNGGGSGRGLTVPNQTLSSDSLRLTATEKTQLKAFIQSLDEQVEFEAPPAKLPKSKIKSLNKRTVAGVY